MSIQRWNKHHNQDNEYIQHTVSFPCLFLLLPLLPSLACPEATIDLIFVINFVSSRIAYERDHITYSLLSDLFYSGCLSLRFKDVVACINIPVLLWVIIYLLMVMLQFEYVFLCLWIFAPAQRKFPWIFMNKNDMHIFLHFSFIPVYRITCHMVDIYLSF